MESRLALPIRMASGAVAANFLLTSACIQNQESGPIATPQIRQMAECPGDARESSVLGQLDKQPLQPLGTEGPEPALRRVVGPERKNVKLGSVVLRGKKAFIEADGLTKGHEEALDKAIHEPYARCALATIKGLNVIATPNVEMGHYIDRPDSESGKAAFEKVQLFFATSKNPDDRSFMNRGSVSALVNHELSHGLYHQWGKLNDKAGNRLFDKLAGLYVEESNQISEGFRKKYKDLASEAASDISKQYRELDLAPHATAMDAAALSFKKEGALDDKLTECFTVDDRKDCWYIGWEGAIDTIMDNAVGDESSDDGVYSEKMSVLEEAQAEYVQKQYPATMEGDVLGEETGTGHPFDNQNELFASSIASDQADPEAVLAAWQKLDPARRQIIFEQRKLITDIVKHYDPRLLEYMNTPQVVERMRAVL